MPDGTPLFQSVQPDGSILFEFEGVVSGLYQTSKNYPRVEIGGVRETVRIYDSDGDVVGELGGAQPLQTRMNQGDHARIANTPSAQGFGVVSDVELVGGRTYVLLSGGVAYQAVANTTALLFVENHIATNIFNVAYLSPAQAQSVSVDSSIGTAGFVPFMCATSWTVPDTFLDVHGNAASYTHEGQVYLAVNVLAGSGADVADNSAWHLLLTI